METFSSFVPSLASRSQHPRDRYWRSILMSEQFEHAQEHLEHAAHEHGGTPSHTRAAIIIGIMAAVLAITEFVAKDASSSYLTNHIAASDTWTQYQEKSVRRTILTAQADLLESLPSSND